MSTGTVFEVDLSEAYFSARLATERQRIAGLHEEGGQVLDMFAGVGPFAITLAGKARRVLAADINPGAVRLMVRNIRLNHADNILPVLTDAARLPAMAAWTFDRVIMNHPTGALAVPAACIPSLCAGRYDPLLRAPVCRRRSTAGNPEIPGRRGNRTACPFLLAGQMACGV